VNETEYASLKRTIRQLLTIDIDAYGSQQMRRRLEAFVARHGASSPMEFCRRLDTDADLLSQLRDMVTINISEFFRDVAQFDYLRSAVLPELLQHMGRISIWSAGCSHGEEPFSIAVILAEMSAEHRARILATDLDRQAIRRAKAGGPYVLAEIRNVPERLLQKYFTSSDKGYAVVEAIRRRVEFREHDLVSDGFEGEFDLLICRNTMIYFSREARSSLCRRLHDSLNPGGVLFVGGTEPLLGPDKAGFERLWGNFYRKSSAVVASTRPELAASRIGDWGG
jgi:chemotaxis protein methyltransferase CheR